MWFRLASQQRPQQRLVDSLVDRCFRAVTVPRGVILGVATLVASVPLTSSAALTLHVDGYAVVNELATPSAVPFPIGDMTFSPDGNTAYFLGGSEGTGSGVWSAPVTRDISGTVTGFGAATNLFYEGNLDSGLLFYPGSTTLMYRGQEPSSQEPSIGQRQDNGAIEHKYIINYDGALGGGMTVVPSKYTNGGSLLSTSYGDEDMYLHTVVDDQDGTYTIGEGEFYGGTISGFGDVAFVLTGGLADSVLYADYYYDEVRFFAVDPQTGLPVGGTSLNPSTFMSWSSLEGPWGLEIDPITNNIFVMLFDPVTAPIVQVSAAANAVPEPSSLIALTLLCGGALIRRRRRLKTFLRVN